MPRKSKLDNLPLFNEHGKEIAASTERRIAAWSHERQLGIDAVKIYSELSAEFSKRVDYTGKKSSARNGKGAMLAAHNEIAKWLFTSDAAKRVAKENRVAHWDLLDIRLQSIRQTIFMEASQVYMQANKNVDKNGFLMEKRTETNKKRSKVILNNCFAYHTTNYLINGTPIPQNVLDDYHRLFSEDTV